MLRQKYAIGCLVMFYEIEMFRDYVDGILNMIKGVENPENITIDIHLSTEQYLEEMENGVYTLSYVWKVFVEQLIKLKNAGVIVAEHGEYVKIPRFTWVGVEPMSIARYRREFNSQYANQADFLLWGETDSFFPQETFHIIESISEHIEKNNENRRYTIVFAYRKMWGTDWKLLEHPEFENEQFQDNDEWTLRNIASEKCYMSIEQMNEINKKSVKYDIRITDEPKFDGSCLVISSEMVKCGVNIPHALLCSGEDTSFGWSAKKILGKNYTQYIIKNILRVHNRRRSKKRLYIKGENNEMGFCGSTDKGLWWSMLVDMSKANLNNLDNPNFKFHTWENYFEKVQGVIK